MPAIAAFLIVLAATSLGVELLRRLRVSWLSDAERVMLGMGIGGLVLAYLILAVGLMGWLTRPVLALLWVLVAAVGAARLPWLARMAAGYLLRLAHSARRWRAGVALAILGIWFVASLPPVTVWPLGNDYDGLAEHLVYAATFLRMGAVRPLWYDHHSQFPLTLQMLYVPALAFGGPAAPKVVHFIYGLLVLAAAYVLTRRHVSRAAAKWAPLVLVGTPLFGWLSKATYVDLGLCAYVLLAVHMFLNWRRSGRYGDLVLAAVMAGAAMAVKMQGISYFGVLALGALYLCWRRRSTARLWRQAAAFVLVGAAVASPWYIKSWVLTGNPVYPFAYSIFDGKGWSAQQALAYSRSQREFGVGELPSEAELARMNRVARIFCGPRRPDRLLLAPVYLTIYPWEFVVASMPRVIAVAGQGIGPLYLGFVFVALGLWPKPRGVAILLWLVLPLWIWWLYSMQLTRYLLPTLVMLTPVVAYAYQRCLGAHRLLRTAAIALMVCAIGFRMWGTLYSGGTALAAHLRAGGRDELLLEQLDVYEPSLYISKYLPQDAKILTYGEPRIFYFNRNAMWGDPGHHQLIPYKEIETPRQLIDAYRRLGVTHVLINECFFPRLTTSREKLPTLLRHAVDEGLLEPMGHFVRHPYYKLFRIAAPRQEGSKG